MPEASYAEAILSIYSVLAVHNDLNLSSAANGSNPRISGRLLAMGYSDTLHTVVVLSQLAQDQERLLGD